MRDAETGQSRLGLAAAAGGAFVADFAAGAGRRAGERRDRGRMVVGFDLDAERASVPALRRGIRCVSRIRPETRAPDSLRPPPRCRCTPTACARGVCAWVCLIILNSDAARRCCCSRPSMVQDALKILWRQCSELACANIISSTSDGSRPSSPKRVAQIFDLVLGAAPGPGARWRPPGDRSGTRSSAPRAGASNSASASSHARAATASSDRAAAPPAPIACARRRASRPGRCGCRVRRDGPAAARRAGVRWPCSTTAKSCRSRARRRCGGCQTAPSRRRRRGLQDAAQRRLPLGWSAPLGSRCRRQARPSR